MTKSQFPLLQCGAKAAHSNPSPRFAVLGDQEPRDNQSTHRAICPAVASSFPNPIDTPGRHPYTRTLVSLRRLQNHADGCVGGRSDADRDLRLHPSHLSALASRGLPISDQAPTPGALLSPPPGGRSPISRVDEQLIRRVTPCTRPVGRP